ncbi:MAG TPA: hypothetical protein EYN66_07000, partial [Myxococcales bacterium]|nr:hypothetical protein [Myxococcales bacterium]
MAFLGDFGKIFLGGQSTGDVAENVAAGLGVTNPATLDAINTGAQATSDFISGTGGGGGVDVSGRPAGVDSPATLSTISQTSVFQGQPGGMNGTGVDSAFVSGFGLGGVLNQIGRQLFKSPGSSALTGFGVGEIVDFFIDERGNQKKLVITRKMQRDVKKLFMLSGGNFEITAELYGMATGR